MRSAAISRLKASLSEYIDVVKAGEEVLVTDRGKPVARIVPVPEERGPKAARMEEMRPAGGFVPRAREKGGRGFWAGGRPGTRGGFARGGLRGGGDAGG